MSDPDDGFGLVAVLLVVLVLSLMAGGLAMLARSEGRSSASLQRQLTAEHTEDAAISIAILGLSDRRPEVKWVPSEVAREVLRDGAAVQVTVTDEAGRLDLNTGDVHALTILLQALGETADASAALADAIRDWTDADDLRRPNGAEADDYRAAGLSYLPRNRPFETSREVMLVKGMTRSVYDKLAPYVTVYSGQQLPDAGRASAFVRDALGLLHAAPVGSSVIAAQPVIDASGGKAYRILAMLEGARPREAVIRLTDNVCDPYWVLSWGYAERPATRSLPSRVSVGNR